MDIKLIELQDKLYRNYLELGEDLYILEALTEKATPEISENSLAGCLIRTRRQINEHMKSFDETAQLMIEEVLPPSAPVPDRLFPCGE